MKRDFQNTVLKSAENSRPRVPKKSSSLTHKFQQEMDCRGYPVESMQKIVYVRDDETGRTLTFFCQTAIIKLTFVIGYDSCDINPAPNTRAQSCTHMVDLLEHTPVVCLFPSLE